MSNVPLSVVFSNEGLWCEEDGERTVFYYDVEGWDVKLCVFADVKEDADAFCEECGFDVIA